MSNNNILKREEYKDTNEEIMVAFENVFGVLEQRIKRRWWSFLLENMTIDELDSKLNAFASE